MPILILGLTALAVFLVFGGILFMAGVSERREERNEAQASTEKAIHKAA